MCLWGDFPQIKVAISGSGAVLRDVAGIQDGEDLSGTVFRDLSGAIRETILNDGHLQGRGLSTIGHDHVLISDLIGADDARVRPVGGERHDR